MTNLKALFIENYCQMQPQTKGKNIVETGSTSFMNTYHFNHNFIKISRNIHMQLLQNMNILLFYTRASNTTQRTATPMAAVPTVLALLDPSFSSVTEAVLVSPAI